MKFERRTLENARVTGIILLLTELEMARSGDERIPEHKSKVRQTDEGRKESRDLHDFHLPLAARSQKR